MKNLTKLFMAVVAGMLAFSCVTDTTEDQAVQLGAGQTTLSISLDGVRTHLGENTGEGYPLYWSAGDKIAVNGVASDEIASEYVGTSGAEFTFGTSALGDPYCLVYPAPAENVAASTTAGLYPVEFPASQIYNVANPDEVAAPMYGYAPAGEPMKLEHLSGILRFTVKGNGEVIESITIKSESGNIAGIFDVNCADGTLTPRADAGNTITISFSDVVTLSDEPTIINVAVPEGNYGIFAVIINTVSDSMVLNFDTTSKPINKGRVRVFNEFTYQANSDGEGVYIIDSKEDLIRFAKIASKFQEYTTYTSAKVAATIDMKDVEWTPIEGFGGAFDGGSEEGYEIKNLTAPLFGTTTATEIKNVKLTDVNIDSSFQHFGAVACKINSSDTVVDNCSVSGTIEINISGQSSQPVVGGIIGYSAEGIAPKLSNLLNEANITVTGSDISTSAYLGGCVGWLPSGSISNSTNLGSIICTASFTANTLFLGGVAGPTLTVTNCYNGSASDTKKGSLTINGSCYTIRFGGILASVPQNVKITNCINYGALTTAENTSAKGSLFIGGIIGISQANNNAVYTSCENRGAITVYGTFSSNMRVGGLAGSQQGNGNYYTITNGFTNSGNIHVANSGSSTGIQIGGLDGNHSDYVGSNSTGVIRNTGNITFSGKTSSTVQLGGIVAAAATGFISNSNITYINEGDLTVDATNVTGNTRSVGGIIANNQSVNNCYSYATITATNCNYVAAIKAEGASRVATNAHCGGKIIKDDVETVLSAENYFEYIYASGNTADLASTKNCGWLSRIDAIPVITGSYTNIGSAEELLAFDFSSNKDILLTDNIDLTDQTWTPVEGYTGTLHGNNKVITGLTAPLFGITQASIVDLRLEEVDIEETENANHIGAFARKIDNANAQFSNCSASGYITVNPANEVANDAYIAGLIGYTTSTKEIHDITNEVNIIVKGQYNAGTYCAGCISRAATASIRKATNLGNITFQGTASTRAALSGIVSNCLKLTDCTNGDKDNKNTKGNLTYDSQSGILFYAGGMVQGIAGTLTYTNCANYGKISSTEGSKTQGIIVGGLVGNNDSASARIYDNCCNYGDIDIQAESTAGNIKVGGIYSQVAGDGSFTLLNNILNEGAITVTINNFTGSKKTAVVGGVASTWSAGISSSSNCTVKNTGAVTYSANTSTASYTRVAGIIAHNTPNHPNRDNYKLINTGDVTAIGAFGTEGFAGGIIGTGRNIYNAKCFCNIVAVGYTYVGMIMATHEVDRKATNCYIGGTIATERADSDNPIEEGDIIENVLSATNYFNYIYDDQYDLTACANDNYYGCKYISAIDAEPAN